MPSPANALKKEGNTYAKNAVAYDKTMGNLDMQLEQAIVKGEFTAAEELFATIAGLRASVPPPPLPPRRCRCCQR